MEAGRMFFLGGEQASNPIFFSTLIEKILFVFKSTKIKIVEVL